MDIRLPVAGLSICSIVPADTITITILRFLATITDHA